MPKGTRSGPGFSPGSTPRSALLGMADSVLIRAKIGLKLTEGNSKRQKDEKSANRAALAANARVPGMKSEE
ncbi:MAG: hypothetical protein NTW21_32730 [Verrucomicrobia bacterium]|nr:hypothetical protein [Verrucomicrobiota bacterium]